MTIEEVKKELEKFNDFKFFEDGHYYECKGKRVGVSVTRLIEEYANEFNAEEMAEKVANKENRLVENILAEWKYKADFACAKGSTCHEYAQSLWSKSIWKYIPFGQDIAFKLAVNKIKKQAKNFKFEYENHLEHLIDELPIGSEEFDIASCVDHLFYNKLTGGLVLVDYKTNSLMSGYNKKAYKKAMKVPLSHLNDDALHHYYIQLSIYKYLIEKYTGLKVEEMFIVYMSENIEKYEIINVPYLKDEVEKILESRRVKKMNSVPVLLIGASGTGKSTSLRNFKKDEIAVANVLGKPLPFKTDIEAPKVDRYDIILKAIASTKKKVIVIDDAGYLLTNEFMNKSSVKGYDKYNEMANNFFNLINGIKSIEGGKTVYLVMHEDTDEYGNVKPKTIGKLLDDKVNIQGMFTICIRSMFENGNYIFRLKTNGQDCVKTPFGMFEDEAMENDLKEFDKVVRDYYELDKKEGEDK
ncbi:MAG: AAA family ATPase [Acutalibacteraceae bacterium]|nr:AAA family ATPase [Acutalibacteraceae bacterium]